MDAIRRTPTEINRATVGAGYAKALFDFAVSRGVRASTLTSRIGVNGEQLKDPDGRIAFAHYVALLRCAKELSGDPAFALHFGAATRVAELSIVGLIGATSDTLAEAFVQTNRYARLALDVAGPSDRMRLIRSGSDAWIVIDFPKSVLHPEVLESAFARMVSTGADTGPNRFVKAVHFTFPPPLYREVYERIFQVDVVFDSDRNAILTDAAWMVQPGPMKSKYVFGILCERGDQLIKELEQAGTFRSKIEELVLPQLHKGAPTMSSAAASLGISRSTLFRRLRNEDLTFGGLVDDLRRRVALEYLAGDRVTVSETAYLTGFSETAAFSRAFRRWTGLSPGRFKATRAKTG